MFEVPSIWILCNPKQPNLAKTFQSDCLKILSHEYDKTVL